MFQASHWAPGRRGATSARPANPAPLGARAGPGRGTRAASAVRHGGATCLLLRLVKSIHHRHFSMLIFFQKSFEIEHVGMTERQNRSCILFRMVKELHMCNTKHVRNIEQWVLNRGSDLQWIFGISVDSKIQIGFVYWYLDFNEIGNRKWDDFLQENRCQNHWNSYLNY